MMLPRRGTLRRRLALAMMAAAGVAVCIGAAGLWLLYALQELLWRRSLPDDVRAAFEAVERGLIPSPEMVSRLMIYGEALERQSPFVDIASMLICATLGLTAAVLLSLDLSRRLGKPIGQVSEAAAAVAAGDLSARVVPDPGDDGEIRQLQDNFNRLVASLAASEREMRENSAAIAHELRTPITVLRLKLQSFIDGVARIDDAELGRLMIQVDLLARLVEDLRTLSLATAGRLDLACSYLDLADEVEAVADAMRPTLDHAGVRLSLDLRPANVLVDRLRLRQCVQALLSNVAQHAAPGREARLETRLVADRARLTVLDRGPGFAPGDEQRALAPFWRGEGSRARRSGGSGLGLAVVRAIADAHDGAVTITARSGGGAAVIIDLPISGLISAASEKRA